MCNYERLLQICSHNNTTKTQPGCKKKCSPELFKMASLKKVAKSKGRPRNGCDDIG